VSFNLDQDGALNSINIVGNETDENIRMDVFDDLGGVPNDLIVETEIGFVEPGIVSFLEESDFVMPAAGY